MKTKRQRERRRQHKLYMIAFERLRELAKIYRTTIGKIAQIRKVGGKPLRRGTPGAFGFDVRPLRSARSNRRGFNVAGNSRDRRFAKRHSHHFAVAQ
jgi:hypothetical protein